MCWRIALHAAFVSKHTAPNIAFMVAGLVELYGLSPAAIHEHVLSRALLSLHFCRAAGASLFALQSG
jgi:hypothetical protein